MVPDPDGGWFDHDNFHRSQMMECLTFFLKNGLNLVISIAIGGVCLLGNAHADDKLMVLASTTSPEQSGLFGAILPKFKAKTGISVRVVALGTGLALDMARRGEADAVFVHDRFAEEKFIAEEHGMDRRTVMHNDFILVGPKNDPAEVKSAKDIITALQKIAKNQSIFVSRNDRSGTHALEMRLWRETKVDPKKLELSWYWRSDSGMGPALSTSAHLDAYTISDRGTWLYLRKNFPNLEILIDGDKDKRLLNVYSIILVNPKKHPHAKTDLAKSLADWFVSEAGQEAIREFKVGKQSLFMPGVPN
jgi:tungstate transport system substrate-binding protein